MSVSVKVAQPITPPVGGKIRWPGGGRALSWSLVLPALLFLLLIGLYPTIYVFALSFSRYQPGGVLEFTGLDNYVRAIQSPRFWHGLYVTAWFAVLSVGIQLVFGFVMALSLQAVNTRVRQIVTTIFLIPMMITPAVVAVVWRLIYHPTLGPINYILGRLGFEAPAWVSSPMWTLPALVIADIWQWTPFMAILLLAGLQSLPREVYEAAYVDGSTSWQAFKDMTLPLMKPFIFLAVFLRIIDAFKMFDLIFIVSRGGPGDLSESIAYYTYVIGFKYFDLGLAAALSVFQLIIIIVLGKLLLGQLSRVSQESRAS
jgi:multiple sugar transport system permease protein